MFHVALNAEKLKKNKAKTDLKEYLKNIVMRLRFSSITISYFLKLSEYKKPVIETNTNNTFLEIKGTNNGLDFKLITKDFSLSHYIFEIKTVDINEETNNMKVPEMIIPQSSFGKYKKRKNAMESNSVSRIKNQTKSFENTTKKIVINKSHSQFKKYIIFSINHTERIVHGIALTLSIIESSKVILYVIYRNKYFYQLK